MLKKQTNPVWLCSKDCNHELLQRGIFIPPSQFETCFVSNAHSEDDADKTVESYNDALRKVKEIL